MSVNSVDTARPGIVTLAALHGTRAEVIGPLVADRLGVEFLDRAIPSAIAKQAGISEEAVAGVDDIPRSRGNRLVATLSRVADARTATGDQVERLDLEEHRLRAEIEAFLVRASRAGGVVLGRGGAVVLSAVPGALHVYLGGQKGQARRAGDGVRAHRAVNRRAARDRSRPRASRL